MSKPEPYVIGLTGNIATGKSTVGRMLRHLGACSLDADRLAHWIMRAGTEINALVVQQFGFYVRRPDGEIDRERLGRIVFGDPKALAILEQLVHPAVVAETLRRIAQTDRPVFCVEAIKLLKARMDRHCNAIWVVTSTRERQIERLMSERGLSAQAAGQRIDAQPPADLKVERAAVVIDNDGPLEDAWWQVLQAWNAISGIDPAPPSMAMPGCLEDRCDE